MMAGAGRVRQHPPSRARQVASQSVAKSAGDIFPGAERRRLVLWSRSTKLKTSALHRRLRRKAPGSALGGAALSRGALQGRKCRARLTG